MKILFVGHGRCGKDEACETLAKATGLKNAGTCSIYLLPFVAERMMGRPPTSDELQACYALRHDHRDEWRRIGDEVRREDPAKLVRLMFEQGDIGGGLRGLPEVLAVRRLGLADLIIWVERAGNPVDPTMEFGAEHADAIILNDGTLEEYRLKIQRLGKCLGGFA